LRDEVEPRGQQGRTPRGERPSRGQWARTLRDCGKPRGQQGRTPRGERPPRGQRRCLSRERHVLL